MHVLHTMSQIPLFAIVVTLAIYITSNTALKLRINFPAGQTCCILRVYSKFFVFTTGTECDPFLIKLNSLAKNSNNSMLVEENIFS